MDKIEEIENQWRAAFEQRNQLLLERNRINQRLDELNLVVEALELAKSVLDSHPARAAERVSENDETFTKPTVRGLKGMKMPKALETLMQESNGRAKIADLVTALEEAGKLKKGKRRTNYSRIYRTLKGRPALFTKSGTGEFRLASSNGLYAVNGG